MPNFGLAFSIGIFITPFIFVILIAWIKSWENRKRMQLLADLHLKALESGQKLPEGLLEQPKKKNPSLRIGIILISVGIGISLFLFLVAGKGEEIKTAAGGLIPIFLGIGFLIVHFVWKNQGLEDVEE